MAALTPQPEVQSPERRNRRSTCLADALRFQLDACREDEGLAAIVVSDELGFCVAHSGGDGTHEELAAQLPLLVHPARSPARDDQDDDTLRPDPASLTLTTFSISGTTLHACAVGTIPANDPSGGANIAVLARVASGFSRLLAT